MYFSNLDCDIGYSDHIFVWTLQLIKPKEVPCLETLGNSVPVMQCHILEDLNPPPSVHCYSLILHCIVQVSDSGVR